MLLYNQHPDNRSMMVALLGVPNAGKSTLINTLIGMELAAVTMRPQTTRHQYHCVLSIDRTELVLVDTPGIHRANQELNRRLVQQAMDGLEGAELALVLIDLTAPLLDQLKTLERPFDQSESGSFGLKEKRSWLVFTKWDAIQDEKLKVDVINQLPILFKRAQEIFPKLEKYFYISSHSSENIHLLTAALCDAAPPGPHLYTDGSLSNKNERFFVAEYIREQAFDLLKEEVPYELAVQVLEFFQSTSQETNQEGDHATIHAVIMVGRPSQRAIVVGKGGQMIKEIGTRARKKIEVMLSARVHLNLHVKVAPQWFKNNRILEELGLPRAYNSPRVWKGATNTPQVYHAQEERL